MEVCTHISLEDAPLDEVIDALNSQAKHNNLWARKLDRVALWGLIRLLEDCNCPREIIKQLDAWEREPIANEQRLQKWVESSNKKQKEG